MDTHSTARFIALCGIPLLAGVFNAGAVTSTDLWNAYLASPDTQPNLPNCSYAGYRTGEAAPPSPAVVADVTAFGATGGDASDDIAAFKAAIAAAHTAGGGAVFVPAGTYTLSNVLHIPYNNVVLRGAGRDLTTLDFTRSLQTIFGNFTDSGSSTSRWWWSGGMIWISPSDTFNAGGTAVIDPAPTINQGWEYWRPGTVLANVTATATAGDTTVTVDSAAGLVPGGTVLMTWENPSDSSFLRHVYGHAATAGDVPDTAAIAGGSVGNCSWILPPLYPRMQWPVEIAAVAGNVVTLKQPLRVDIRTAWQVRFSQLGPVVEESGVENLRIKCHAQLSHTHLQMVPGTIGGWNGIYLNRARNCWVRNVAVTSAEEGVILSATKNVSVLNVLIDGVEQNHHSFACRVNSHDNLFESFSVNGPHRVRHGINTEWFSSGNVWSKGFQRVGCFDSHRALSFDSIRTECTVANDTGSTTGGADQAGPFIGKRIAHWNVNVSYDGSGSFTGSRGGDDVYEPRQYPMGALVGVRGVAQDTSEGEAMPTGDKGTLVADPGAVPPIANLYEAQRQLRFWSTLNVTVPDPLAREQGAVPGNFSLQRTGSSVLPVVVNYTVNGSATNGADYATLSGQATLPADASSLSLPVTPVDDHLAEGNETVALTLAASANYSLGAQTSGNLTIQDAPYDQWRLDRFGPNANTPAIAGDSVDLEPDGLKNLSEYLFCLNPNVPDTAPAAAPVSLAGVPYLVLTFTRRTNDSSLTYLPQLSPDLGDWNAGPPVQLGPPVDHLDGTETVSFRDNFPLGGETRRFMRLRVNRTD